MIAWANDFAIKARLRVVALSCQYLLFALGFSGLGYCAIVLGIATYFQCHARRQLQSESKSTIVNPTEPSIWPSHLGVRLALLGKVYIDRINLSVVVAEGIKPPVLRVAVGHVPGTALPWQPGNVVLAAHRDSFFRRLGELKPGDIIRLTVPSKDYRYRVTFTDVVDPKETWVMQPSTGESLTLITCYPFHFVGPAPKRFVVRARLINE
jgi:LPXTG-site transpeptidase (sortase) family protein